MRVGLVCGRAVLVALRRFQCVERTALESVLDDCLLDDSSGGSCFDAEELAVISYSEFV